MSSFPLHILLLIAVAFGQIFGGVSCCCLSRSLFSDGASSEKTAKCPRCLSAKSVNPGSTKKSRPVSTFVYKSDGAGQLFATDSQVSQVAEVLDTTGPNVLNRENVQRRVAVFCNVQGRDLASVVRDIRTSLAAVEASFRQLPGVYYLEYSGQFEAQRDATLRLCSLLGPTSKTSHST